MAYYGYELPDRIPLLNQYKRCDQDMSVVRSDIYTAGND